MQKEDCLFCKIARGEIPSQKVYEDDEVIAFKDIHPAAPVHLLIIPKQHYDSLAVMGKAEEPLLGKMLALAPVLAKEAGANNGFRVVINTGHDGGQEVNHITYMSWAARVLGQNSRSKKWVLFPSGIG